jgi:hypothetical protein
VCPQIQGGTFGSDRNSGWWVDANYYRWLTTGSSASCGWDIRCQGNEPRCTPNYQNTSMSFFSNCFLTKGTSCGYDYDWITFYNWTGSYCSQPSVACGETTIGEAPPCCPTNPPCTGDGICSTDPVTGYRFCCDPKIGHCP